MQTQIPVETLQWLTAAAAFTEALNIKHTLLRYEAAIDKVQPPFSLAADGLCSVLDNVLFVDHLTLRLAPLYI